ncbi:hypothetical protein [Microbispora sp. NPDC049633]|uniref:hypothetical protein n=1 Tax=Microbispora sp. NPDC049633 TaxID=3154355 RepID=UPI003435A545
MSGSIGVPRSDGKTSGGVGVSAAFRALLGDLAGNPQQHTQPRVRGAADEAAQVGDVSYVRDRHLSGGGHVLDVPAVDGVRVAVPVGLQQQPAFAAQLSEPLGGDELVPVCAAGPDLELRQQAALECAVREEIIPRNAAKLVKVPVPKYKVNRGLTVPQARATL